MLNTDTRIALAIASSRMLCDALDSRAASKIGLYEDQLAVSKAVTAMYKWADTLSHSEERLREQIFLLSLSGHPLGEMLADTLLAALPTSWDDVLELIGS